MTYKEKLKKEYPECVDITHPGGCKGCPASYGYETTRYCDVTGITGTKLCAECWDREIEDDDKPIDFTPMNEPAIVIKEQIKQIEKPKKEERTHVTDSASYAEGMDDVWSMIRKVHKMSNAEIAKIFDVSEENAMDEFLKLNAKLAVLKLKSYEESRAFSVGDVVAHNEDSGLQLLITYVDEKIFDGIKVKEDSYGKLGSSYSKQDREDWYKTGKHIDLEQIYAQF